MKYWVKQRKGYELGNFIMITPAIRLIYRCIGRPVPVFFETNKLIEVYQNCKFIKVVKNKPRTKPTISSCCTRSKVDKRNKRSEYHVQCVRVCRTLDISKPERWPLPYIDHIDEQPFTKTPNKKYVAIFHGCLAKEKGKVERKTVHPSVRDHMINRCLKLGLVPVLIGSRRDKVRFWQASSKYERDLINLCGKLSLGSSVAALANCDAFVSNDTGLYHAAGALQIPGLVLWKRTDLHKNRSPFRGIRHCISMSGDRKVYIKSINDFLGHLQQD